MPAKPKVVLFFPDPVRGNDDAPAASSPGFPMAILALAGPLRAAGFEPVLLYEGIEDDLPARLLDACSGALFLGVSSMTGNQLRGAIEYACLVKESLPELPVIWGGYHPSILPEQTLAEPYVDVVVRGQGEEALVELARALLAGRSPEGIAGVMYKEAGQVRANPSRPPLALKELPPLAYDLLDVDKIITRNSPTFRSLQYLSSSGCPFSCGFCAEPLVNERKWMGRPAGQVVREVAELVRQHRLDHVTFIDPNFFVSLKRAREILKGIIDAGLDIQWSAVARVDQVLRFDDGLWQLIRESGCRSLGVGAESGSPEILSLIDKRIEVDDIFECARRMKANGVGGTFSFMIGFPLDPASRRQEMERTLKAVRMVKAIHAEIKTPVCYYAPYPGSPLYPVALREGFRAPRTLAEWADFGFTSVATPWVSGKEMDFVERCSTFYLPLAFPDQRLVRWADGGIRKPALAALGRIARLRASRDRYGWPLEWQAARMAARIAGRHKPFHISQFYS